MDVVRALGVSACSARNLSSSSARGKRSFSKPCGLWIARKTIHRFERMTRRRNVEVDARGPSKSGVGSVECSQDTGSLVLLAGYVSWWKVYVAWMGTVVSLSALLIAVPQFGRVGGLLGQGDLVGLSRNAGILSLALLVRAVAQYVQDALLWEVAAGVTRRIRQTVFSRLQGADIRTFEIQSSSTGTEVDGYEVGDLTYRLTAEAEKAGEMSFAALQRLIPGLLQLIAMLVRMLVTSPLLTGCTLFVAPVMGAAIAGIGNLVRRHSKDTQAATAALSSYLAEIFPAMHIVRTHGGEHHEEARFCTLAAACESTKIRAERVRMVLPAAMTIIYTVTVLVLFFAGCWAINQGQISGEDMISFLSAVVLLVEPIQGCSIAYNELRQGEAAIERLLSLLHVQKSSVFAFRQKEEDQELERDNEFLVPNQALAVSTHGLSYRYKNASRDALCKVCITVEPGQCAWIVGASGSGKSTLAKLLLGLYKPTSGYICLGQERICDMNEAKFRSLVGYVPQDSRLLNGTVADNISYAMVKDPQRIHEVAETSRVNVFLDVAPCGYMTPVGASGSSLSGGQKQRVAIARALYRNPRVLVLDEATSSLDSSTASELRAQLALAIEGITTIVVAHRLDGAELADVIYVLEEGNVVESGTHAQLIERGGLYRDLWYDSRSGVSSGWSAQENA